MMFGMTIFTLVHVLISLIGIVAGLVVLRGMLVSQRMDSWTAVFLVFTILTSLTGFLFPMHGFTPALGVGGLSMIVLIATVAARYTFKLAGTWRVVYIAGAVVAEYFNCFVLVVQLFLKVPALHALAPKGNEPPFAIVQGLLLLFFLVTGILAIRRFRAV